MRTEKLFLLLSVCAADSSLPVWGRGEKTQDDVSSLHVDDVARGVQEVEVEVWVSWDRAVEPRLQEGGPLFLKDTLRAAQVRLAHTSHTGHHHLE